LPASFCFYGISAAKKRHRAEAGADFRRKIALSAVLPLAKRRKNAYIWDRAGGGAAGALLLPAEGRFSAAAEPA